MRRWMGIPVAVLLTACVTINVYFPAAEAKEAAKEFVEKVIGDEAKPPAKEGEDKPGGQGASLSRPVLSAPLRIMTARKSWTARASLTSSASCSTAQRSKLRGWTGTRSVSATVRAARKLPVSRPPQSMMMSSYFGASWRTWFRSSAPCRLTAV